MALFEAAGRWETMLHAALARLRVSVETTDRPSPFSLRAAPCLREFRREQTLNDAQLVGGENSRMF
jgi:hypothetical protein